MLTPGLENQSLQDINTKDFGRGESMENIV